ncbi:MAG: prephenate dehydratase domain-containing protein [Candidatus Gracilibacteria bacterium]|nr:prephenate dehydratase domain-containing protein [Candidatus Gracilibacteria bacterium]MDQ7023262.1 prephenate dehydratase domain-containing protein [Candidatus Gracilibacteria bacterium]
MTKIYYQGEEGSYHHQASLEIIKNLNIKVEEMIGLDNFEKCWEKIGDESILILAIENSYAGTIYENLYKFNNLDIKIIGEINLPIDHAICSVETDLSKINKVYSHFKALPQCYNYFKKHNIKEQIIVSDTAGAAIQLSKTKEKGAAAICSKLAGEMYGLNILEEAVQDQKGNTTRFVIIVPKKSEIKYSKKENKISILFEAKNIPASLYKCLGAFATNNVNLSKIESLPNIKNPFSYLFWLDFEGKLEDKNVIASLEELSFFTSNIKIIGEY